MRVVSGRRSGCGGVRGVAGRAALVGGAAVVVLMVLVVPDYLATRGRMVEVATVTEQTMTRDLTRCGKDLVAGSFVQRTSFRVADPVDGFPEVFTYWGCPLDQSVGDTVGIVRLGPVPGDGVYFEPMTTLGQVARFVAAWSGAAAAGAAVCFGFACRTRAVDTW